MGTGIEELLIGTRALPRAVLVAAIAVVCNPSPAQAQELRGRLEIADVRVIGRDAVISYVISSAMDQWGNVYALDPDNRQVLKFSPDGELLWRSGRRGGGPGEYEMPSRIAVDSRGRTHVLDIARQGLTVLDSAGAYVSYGRFAPPVRNADRMLVLGDGRIVLSGIAEFLRGAGRAVHIYSAGLVHDHSFGEPPSVRNSEHARLWGVGGVTQGPSGTFFFSRRVPYEIYQYRPDGTLVRRWVGPTPIEHTPDEAFVTRRNGLEAVTTLGADVSKPLPAIPVGSEYFISGLTRREDDVWHLFSLVRGYQSEVSLPEGWTGVIGYDDVRGYLWGYGESEMEPVLFRARARVVER